MSGKKDYEFHSQSKEESQSTEKPSGASMKRSETVAVSHQRSIRTSKGKAMSNDKSAQKTSGSTSDASRAKEPTAPPVVAHRVSRTKGQTKTVSSSGKVKQASKTVSHSSIQTEPSQPRKRRWSLRILLVLVVTALCVHGYPFAESYVKAAIDPEGAMLIAVKRVRKAEIEVDQRLKAISKRQKDYDDVLSLVVASVDDYKAASKGFRDISWWLIQERPETEAAIENHISALKKAIPRIQVVEKLNKDEVQRHPEGDEFNNGFKLVERNYAATVKYFQKQIATMQEHRHELADMERYAEDVLLFLDQFDNLLAVVKVTKSKEAQRIEEYFATFRKFKKEFQRMLTLLGSVDA